MTKIRAIELADCGTADNPKNVYRVYQCRTSDWFNYDKTELLYETDDLAAAHGFAYGKWLQDEDKSYTIIQPYDGSCRGGYGFPEQDPDMDS